MPNALGLPVGVFAAVGEARYEQLAGPTAWPAPPAFPSAPTAFVLLAGDGNDGAAARWEPPLVSRTPVTAYRARVLDEAGAAVPGTTMDLPADARSVVTTFAQPGRWVLAVAAINAAGVGDEARGVFTNEIVGEEPTDATLPPAAPATVTGSTPAGGQLRVDWMAPPEAQERVPVTGYRVEVLNPSGVVVTRAEPIAGLSHVFTGLADGTYTPRVSALSSKGPGAPRSGAAVAVSSTVLAPPLAPGNVVAAVVDGVLSVTYTAPAASAARAAVTGYRHEFMRGTTVLATQVSADLTGSHPLFVTGSHTVRVTALSASGPSPSATSNAVSYTAPTLPAPSPTPLPTFTPRPAPRPSTYREFRFQSGVDNTAGLRTFHATAAEQGQRAVRWVGEGLLRGPIFLPTDVVKHYKHDAQIILTDEVQGNINIAGTLGTRTYNITGGWDAGSNVLTLDTTEGLAVGDDVVALADYLFSHKDTNPGDGRRITKILGNTVELDAPLYRTVPAARGGVSTRRRLHKAQLAPSFEMEINGGVVRHRDWKGMRDGDNFVDQYDVFVLALCDAPYIGAPGAPLYVHQVGGPAIKTTFVRGGEIHLSAHRIPDLTRDSASIAHWGYGISVEGGELGMRVWLEASYVRHAMTTDHNNWLSQSHWEARGINRLTTYGEAARCRFVYDVHETMSTGVNTHESGWDNEHVGVIRDTGQWGALAELKRDPTGLFFRARRDHVGPEGMLIENIALKSKSWTAAVTIAEASPEAIAPYTLAEGPALERITLRNFNCQRGFFLKQRGRIGYSDIYCRPGQVAIDVTAAAAGSVVTGPIRIYGGGKVVGAQYLNDADLITYA